MSEVIKSIKISLPYIGEDKKLTLREQVVFFKRAVEKDANMGFGYGGNLVFYSMGLSIVIPTHIHKKLKGSYVGRKTDRREYMQYEQDFKKTITSDSLEALTKRYREIVLDYKWLIDIESQVLTKVIFYKFDGESKNTKSQWNGIKIGKDIEINYGYIIGYISEDGKTRYNEDKKSFHKSYDSGIINWNFVEYSEIRYAFFYSVYSKFEGIIKELKNFEEVLTEKSIDTIISSQPKLL